MNIKVNKFKDFFCCRTVGKKFLSATQPLKWTAVRTVYLFLTLKQMITSYKTKHEDVNSRYKMAEFAATPSFPKSFTTKTSQNSKKKKKKIKGKS